MPVKSIPDNQGWFAGGYNFYVGEDGSLTQGRPGDTPASLSLGADPAYVGGVAYFNRSTKPVERSVGVPLVIGDRWYKTDDRTEWGFNGTYWLTTQVYGPRGSHTFLSNPESFTTINNGVGLVYGAFVEKLVFLYKARSIPYDALNYRRFDFVFRGAWNQTDEFNYYVSIPLDGIVCPYPTTTYTTITYDINTYAGARGDISAFVASSTIVAGSPDLLDASFALFVRGVAP